MTGDDVRQKWDETARRHLYGPLIPGVELQPATAEEHERHRVALWKDDGRPAPFDLTPLLSDEDRERGAGLAAVRTPPLEHMVHWMAGDQVIGSYWGVQEDYGRYYMISTVIHPDHQRRGLYRAFLPRLIATVRDVGFRQIYSRHRADNNAVLIPKLQAGFVIAALEIEPRHGILVHLRLYLHDGLGKLFTHRIDGSYAAELRAAGVEVP